MSRGFSGSLVRCAGFVLLVALCRPLVAQDGTDPTKLLAEAERLAWLKAWTRAAPLYAEAEKLFSARGRGLTGSWSKGRSARFAYYHCRPACRAINVSKTRLEGLFVEELERLQPTPAYMRLIKESVLRAWHDQKSAVRQAASDIERRVKAIQQRLDRLDEAFIFAKSIDLDTYERQRDKLREELTLAQIDRHATELDELDVEGILAFAERVLPRAADLWVQASLDQRQRLQQLFFPEGIAFDGNGFVRTAASTRAFSDLTEIQPAKTSLVDHRAFEPFTRNRLREPSAFMIHSADSRRSFILSIQPRV